MNQLLSNIIFRAKTFIGRKYRRRAFQSSHITTFFTSFVLSLIWPKQDLLRTRFKTSKASPKQDSISLKGAALVPDLLANTGKSNKWINQEDAHTCLKQSGLLDPPTFDSKQLHIAHHYCHPKANKLLGVTQQDLQVAAHVLDLL